MILILITLLFPILSHAIVLVPDLNQGPVIDLTHQVSSVEITEMNQKILELYKKGSGPQIAILVIPSLNGEAIEPVAHQIFTTWKLGDKLRDDGVLFLISANDHRMRIEVGRGLEGSLTDARSKEILVKTRDFFRSNQFGTGLKVGLDGIMSVLNQPSAVQTYQREIPNPKKWKIIDLVPLGLLLLLIFFTIKNFNNKNRNFKEIKHNFELTQQKVRESLNVQNDTDAAFLLQELHMKLTIKNIQLEQELERLNNKKTQSSVYRLEQLNNQISKLELAIENIKTNINESQKLIGSNDGNI